MANDGHWYWTSLIKAVEQVGAHLHLFGSLRALFHSKQENIQLKEMIAQGWQNNLLIDLEERLLEGEMRLNTEEVRALLEKAINRSLKTSPSINKVQVEAYCYKILENDVRFSEFKKFVAYFRDTEQSPPQIPYQGKSGQFYSSQSTNAEPNAFPLNL